MYAAKDIMVSTFCSCIAQFITPERVSINKECKCCFSAISLVIPVVHRNDEQKSRGIL